MKLKNTGSATAVNGCIADKFDNTSLPNFSEYSNLVPTVIFVNSGTVHDKRRDDFTLHTCGRKTYLVMRECYNGYTYTV